MTDLGYDVWKEKFAIELDKRAVRNFRKELLSNLWQMIVLIVPLSSMITYCVVVYCLKISAEMAFAYAMLHLSIGLCIFLFDIILVFVSVIGNRYLVTSNSFYTVRDVMKRDDGKTEIIANPYGETNTIKFVLDVVPIFEFITLPVRYPVKGLAIKLYKEDKEG